MRLDSFEDHIKFEKIRKRRREELPYLEQKYVNEVSQQTEGSIHLVEDRLVRFEKEERDDYHRGSRPGAVRKPPTDPCFETEWIPFSSQVRWRRPEETVMLLMNQEPVEKDCCALLLFRCKYKCITLVPSKRMLSRGKIEEINNKIARL